MSIAYMELPSAGGMIATVLRIAVLRAMVLAALYNRIVGSRPRMVVRLVTLVVDNRMVAGAALDKEMAKKVLLFLPRWPLDILGVKAMIRMKRQSGLSSHHLLMLLASVLHWRAD